MTDHPSASSAPSRQAPIRERTFTMGDVTGVNGYRANRTLLRQRLAEGGYQVQETPHFLLCTREEAPKTLLVHWFAPGEIDADIGRFFIQELKPFGMLAQPQNFGNVFAAVVCSLFPHDPQRALRLYADNALRRYRHALTNDGNELSPADSTIRSFAMLYRRVCQLHVGESFLDAGCSFGFLPLLIAEHFPSLRQVVGVDIQTDSFAVVRAIAEEQHLKHVQFARADLLIESDIDGVNALGRFDTVTALHVLEHFTEADMYRALANLLKLMSKRLIVAVPYEPGEPERAYGHEQRFSHARLEAVGRWCVEQLEGVGHMWVEECAGGLLVVEGVEGRRQ